jgi:hypothetical protein
MSITLHQFERIDGLLTKQIRAGSFETCADPRQYIITSNILLDACADALGREFTERYASAEDCAAAIVTQALLCPDFVEQDA